MNATQPSAPLEAPDPLAEVPSLVRPAGVELWLASSWRRLLLMLLAALLLSVLATLIWAEAVDEFADLGQQVDWLPGFKRRLIFWTSWALVIEPIAWIGRLSVRYGRHWSVMLLLEIPLSIFVARGMDHGVRQVSDAVLGRPPGPPGRMDGAGPGARRPDDHRRGSRLQLPPPPAARPSARERRRFDKGSVEERRELRDAFDQERRTQKAELDEFRMARRRERGEMAEVERYYRNRADLGIFLYWVILGLAWGVRTYLSGRQQERVAAALESDLERAKLANLRNQLNPHFLFNSLHSVGGLIRKHEEQAALGMLSNLGGLLRASLESAKQHQSTLAEELELVEQLLAIEAIRLGDRLRVTTRIDAGLGATGVPALVLLPLVENAVKYGIAPRPKGGTLELSAWADDQYTYVELLDDGPGFDAETLAGDILPSARRTPIGITNTRARLAGLYGDAGVLKLSNRTEGGARVLMRVPKTGRS